MEKIIRGLFNFIRILIIKLRCGRRANIYYVQPMRIKSQLMVQKHINGVRIGQNFKLETDAKVRVIDGGTLEIGANCFINCGTYITAMGRISIGDGCMIGPNVMIFDHDHAYKALDGIRSGQSIIGEIEIGNNVWIGAGCVILRGAKIGNDCVIAAGSIVKGQIEEDTLYYQKKEAVTRKIRRG